MLITVDQEGGRVQRFREGYSLLPPLQAFEAEYARDPQTALAMAEEHAWLMASEICATGIDMSFAPVVDLGRGNKAIGNRAFAAEPRVVAEFTRSYVRGMHAVGMAATLKHFPGHGTVLEDTHFDDAVDPRPLGVLRNEDLVPFVAGIDAGADAVMMAHVRYPAVAPEPAGFSSRWINDILRNELGFRGVVFSDDIGMAAANTAGGVKAKIDAHLDAGCDVVLACHPDIAAESLRAVEGRKSSTAALLGLMGRGALGWDGLLADNRYLQTQSRLAGLHAGASPPQHTHKGLA
jgi:beta-N-acetylhexosaminidase